MRFVDNWKKLWKSYSMLALFANILTALSISGLAVLGVIGSGMAFGVLACTATVFGVLGVLGRVIKQDLEDDGKMFYEEEDTE